MATQQSSAAVQKHRDVLASVPILTAVSKTRHDGELEPRFPFLPVPGDAA